MRKGFLIGLVVLPLLLLALLLAASYWSGQRLEAELRTSLASMDGTLGFEVRDLDIRRGLRRSEVRLSLLPGGPPDALHREELAAAGLPESPLEYELRLDIDHGPVLLGEGGPRLGLAAGTLEMTEPGSHLIRKYGDKPPAPGTGHFVASLGGAIAGEYRQPSFEGVAWGDFQGAPADLRYRLRRGEGRYTYRYVVADGRLRIHGVAGDGQREWSDGLLVSHALSELAVEGVLLPDRYALEYRLTLPELHQADPGLPMEQWLRDLSVTGAVRGGGRDVTALDLDLGVDDWETRVGGDTSRGRDFILHADAARHDDGAWFGAASVDLGNSLLPLPGYPDPVALDSARLAVAVEDGPVGVDASLTLETAGAVEGDASRHFTQGGRVALEGLDRDGYGAFSEALQRRMRLEEPADGAALADLVEVVLREHFDAVLGDQTALMIGPVWAEALESRLEFEARFPIRARWLRDFGPMGLLWPQPGLRGELVMDRGFIPVLSRLIVERAGGETAFLDGLLEQQLEGMLLGLVGAGMVIEEGGVYRTQWQVRDEFLMLNDAVDVTSEYQQLLHQLLPF